MRLDKQVSWIGIAALALAFAPACGGSTNNGNGADGGGGVDSGVTVQGSHHQYVISKINAPTDKSMYAFDLDGDGVKDNQLGTLIGVLTQLGGMSFNVQDTIDTQIQQGSIILLADLQATSLTSATNSGFQIYLGANPSTPPCDSSMPPNCGQHLDGMTHFDIAQNSPMNALVTGGISGGKFTGGPGNLALSLSLVAGSQPVNVRLVGARVEIDTISDTGLMTGRIGGGIPEKDIKNNVYPAVDKALEAQFTMSCSTGGGSDGGSGAGMDAGSGTCSCTGSLAPVLESVFDSNHDCMLTDAEINTQLDSFIVPDVDLLDAQGNFDPDKDGVKDSVSLGVGFTAVGAMF